MNELHFVYPFIHWWTLGFFLLFGDYEQCCCENTYISISIFETLLSAPLGLVHRMGIAGSDGNSEWYGLPRWLSGKECRPVPELQERQVRSLRWEDSLEEEMAPDSSILAWKVSMDRGTWWVTVHGSQKSQTQLSDWAHTHGNAIDFFFQTFIYLTAPGLVEACVEAYGLP